MNKWVLTSGPRKEQATVRSSHSFLPLALLHICPSKCAKHICPPHPTPSLLNQTVLRFFCVCVCVISTWCVCVCVLVAQSCPTLCDPVDCNLPGSSVHEIFQARILEWVAISFSKGSSQPRDRTRVSCTAGKFFTD